MALFRGRLAESAEWTRAELDVNPGNAMAWYQLGDVYVREAKWDQAIAMLQRSLWMNPFYSGPYILLGRAYIKTGQTTTAEAMLRRAIQYDPNNRSAHYLLAQLLQQLGRHAEAKAEFAIAEKLQGQPGR
jgi:tetratricopeptide (TPR) repeat protein